MISNRKNVHALRNMMYWRLFFCAISAKTTRFDSNGKKTSDDGLATVAQRLECQPVPGQGHIPG